MKRRENNRCTSFLTWSALAGVTMLVASPAIAQNTNIVVAGYRGVSEREDPETRMKAAYFEAWGLIFASHGAPPFDIEEQQGPLPGDYPDVRNPKDDPDVTREPTDIHNERPRLDIGIDDPGGGAEPADEPAITAGDPDSGSERAKKESRRLLDKTVDSSDEPTSISAERPRLDVALPGGPLELDQPDSISNERDDDSIDAGEYPPAEMADIAPVIDMWYVLTFWGTDEPNADLDGDGVVDVIDLLLALAEDPDPHFDVRYLLWYLAQRADDFAPEERNDYNGPDIFIPMSDLLWRIIEMWGTNDRVADINNDGIVDMFDFIEAMQMLRLPPYAINALLDFLSDLVDGPIAMPGVMDTLTMEPDRPDHNLYPDATPPDEDTDLGPVESCPSDCANDDGVVDASDLLRLLSEWGTPGPHACDVVGDRFDAHGDGVVDVNDILSLLAAWGKCS